MEMISRFSVVIGVVLSVSTALGQSSRGGGHGRSRGDDRSTSAGDASGHGSRTESFLRRMDSNGNGTIDAEEVAGDQKAFVERMFSRAGIEPKYPLPISQILQAMTNSDHTRGSDGSGRSGSSGGPSTSGNKPSAGDSSRAQPGFGFGQAKSSSSQPSASGFGQSSGVGTKSVVIPGPSNSSPAPAASPATAKPPASVTSSAPSTSSPQPASADPSKPANAEGNSASPAIEQKPVRKSWRFLTPRERLTGLPEWFLRKDADGDGQVTMAEYAKDCTPAEAVEFDRLDLNHDGITTAAECLKGEKRSDRHSN